MTITRQWTTFRHLTTCGCCLDEIPPGFPVQEIIGRHWRKVRCERCADGPRPAVIAEAPKAPQAPQVMGAKVADLVARLRQTRDWKMAQ